MSWLVFALCGPILWAVSTHLDKYLVERYFKDADVLVLLVFTALMGLVLMPIIAWFEPGVFQRDGFSIGLMALSVANASVLTLISIGLVNGLVWYGRLHYRLLKPALEPQTAGGVQ